MRFATWMMLLLLVQPATAAGPGAWKDPSPHRQTFVVTTDGSRIEVLDWGGRGPPLILLAGSGNTAHVFDDFAQQLTKSFHVYGLTRRGFGVSTAAENDFSAHRLGEDVLEVVERLQLSKPLLVGHSFAGQELSAVAAKAPSQIRGLVYLDAVFTYDPDFDRRGLYLNTEWKTSLQRLQDGLRQLEGEPFDSREVAKKLLEQDFPAVTSILETLIQIEDARPARPPPTEADLVSFSAVQEWYRRGSGVTLPEAELRQMLLTDAGGRPTMRFRASSEVTSRMQAGRSSFAGIVVPALGLFAAMDRTVGSDASPEGLASFVTFQNSRAKVRMAQFAALFPNGRSVLMSEADYYIFLSHPVDVVRQIQAFANSLP